MADASQIQALTNAITALVGAVAALPAAPAPRAPVHDLYAATAAFDLSTRAGADAFSKISELDISVFSLFPFIDLPALTCLPVEPARGCSPSHSS